MFSWLWYLGINIDIDIDIDIDRRDGIGIASRYAIDIDIDIDIDNAAYTKKELTLTGPRTLSLMHTIVYCLLLQKSLRKAEGDDNRRTYFPKDPWASPRGITPYLPNVPVAAIPET